MLVIPDVHGRPFWKAAEKYIEEFDDEIVFLGDYADPYPEEFDYKLREKGWGYAKKTLQNMEEIFGFARAHRDRVTLLFGNHCYHYIEDIMPCGRFDERNANEYRRLFRGNSDLLRVAKLVGNVLFTHAGVSLEWMRQHMPDVRKPQELEERLNALGGLHPCKPLGEASLMRGGPDLYSGPLWLDHRETGREDNDGIRVTLYGGCAQVFGHTQRVKEGSFWSWDQGTAACVDSRRCFTLNPHLKPKAAIESLCVWGDPVDWEALMND